MEVERISTAYILGPYLCTHIKAPNKCTYTYQIHSHVRNIVGVVVVLKSHIQRILLQLQVSTDPSSTLSYPTLPSCVYQLFALVFKKRESV